MAPLTAGTNCLTKTEDAVIDLLANTLGVQAFLGTATYAAAKQKIYLHTIPEPLRQDAWTEDEWSALFPCIIVMAPEDGDTLRFTASSRDDGLGFDAHTKFSLRMEAYATADEDNDEEATRKFLEAAGTAVEGMKDRVGTAAGEYQFTAMTIKSFFRGRYERYSMLGDTLGLRVDLESLVE